MSASVGGHSLGWGAAGGISPLELESSGPAFPDTLVDSRFGRRRVLVAGTLVTLVTLALMASFFAGRTSCAAGDRGVDVTAPEGSFTDFNVTLDWRGRPRSLSVGSAAVASDHERCGEHGVRVLRAGGNAVDAAVATCLCQGLYNPMASGIGGGGLILVRAPNGTGLVFDARETAPALAKKNMFKGKGPEDSLRGGKAVAVPMEIHGLYEAHRTYGRRPWQSLFAEAISLAREGFQAHPYLVSAIQSNSDALLQVPELRETFFVLRGAAGGTDEWVPPRVNETCCKRPALADVLRDISERGPDALYKGVHAAGLAKDIRDAGGLVTEADLAAAAARRREPIRASVFGSEILVPPPPSSGVAILLAIRILEGFREPLAGMGAVGLHRSIEAMKHAFAVRMHLGDDHGEQEARNKDVIADALSLGFADELRSLIRDDVVLDVDEYGGRYAVRISPEDHGTSHLSVVDEDGMAVSLTTTINTSFGSKVVSKSTGILLNNQMDDFSSPGKPNVYGLYPSESNFIAAGKRPLSSMSPMVVVGADGQLRMVLGASGGSRITTAVFQTLLRILTSGEGGLEAVHRPRWHTQLVPATVQTEAWGEFRFPDADALALEKRGHKQVSTDWGAVVQAILVGEDGRMEVVSDARKDGAPAGW